MWLLVGGVALWAGVHLIPTVGAGLRRALVGRMGLAVYRGFFSLGVLTAVALMVLGWRQAQPVMIYAPPPELRFLAVAGPFVAILLMFAAPLPTRLRRVIRHPQLTGVVIWAFSHLLVNGDSRSLALFGGLGLWALLEMPLINRREGPWRKPEAPSLSGECLWLAVGLLAAAVAAWAHPWFTGMPALPGVFSP